MSSDMLTAAAALAEQGYNVFPIFVPLFDADGVVRCSCHAGPACAQIGKHPRVLWVTGTPGHPNLRRRPATTAAATVSAWWRRWPDDGIGIATGRGSGVVVIDVDKRSKGLDTLGLIDAEHGWAWATARVLTPGGGVHFYYRCPPGGLPSSTHQSRTAGGRVDPLGPGIDVRGDGGMVVAPPSLHKSGGRYVWQYDLVLGGDRHVVDLP
jgi:putative DNA primase/helicase